MWFRNTFTSLTLIVLFLASCSEDDVPKAKSGYFTLTRVQSPSNGRTTGNAAAVDFDLGNLKASREFYFLLGNGGENPITDITLETNDARFIVSPQSISTLDGTTSGSGTIIPLISLGVIHGVQLNGVGFTDILEMGENSIVLTIKGKTIENGITIDLESEFNFKVNAKQMDIKLSEDGTEIDLENPISSSSGIIGAGGLGAVPGYALSSRIVTIENTGNVDIRVVIKFVGETEVFHDMVLTPNQSADFDLTHPESEEPVATLISLDGNGTVTDYARIQLGNDGKGYFIMN